MDKVFNKNLDVRIMLYFWRHLEESVDLIIDVPMRLDKEKLLLIEQIKTKRVIKKPIDT